MNRRYAVVIGMAVAFVVGILLALSLVGHGQRERRHSCRAP